MFKDFIEILADIWRDGVVGKLFLIITIVMLSSIPLAIKAGAEKNKQWDLFKKEHNCIIVERQGSTLSAQAAPIISSNGSLSIATVTTGRRAQDAWLCDDGVTYWKASR